MWLLEPAQTVEDVNVKQVTATGEWSSRPLFNGNFAMSYFWWGLVRPPEHQNDKASRVAKPPEQRSPQSSKASRAADLLSVGSHRTSLCWTIIFQFYINNRTVRLVALELVIFFCYAPTMGRLWAFQNNPKYCFFFFFKLLHLTSLSVKK